MTIRRMGQYAAEDSRSPIVRDAVFKALPNDLDLDFMKCAQVVQAIYQWVADHIRFTEDDVPAERGGFGKGNEVLVRPVDILRMPTPQGDCDCFSMLLVSMLMYAARLLSLDLRECFVTVAADRSHPAEFSHVYPYAIADG
jgi:hypothetical protein